MEDRGFGRLKQRRGGHQSRDGHVKVEWEVTEWTEGDDVQLEGSATPSKRKIGELETGEDADMRNV